MLPCRLVAHNCFAVPFLCSTQIYKYEAELLRMLQYDVGMISNPLRVSVFLLCLLCDR